MEEQFSFKTGRILLRKNNFTIDLFCSCGAQSDLYSTKGKYDSPPIVLLFGFRVTVLFKKTA